MNDIKSILETNGSFHWRLTDDGTGTLISGTKAAAGDNTLISAPAAGLSIVVDWFTIQNESATATTMILKAGAAEGPRYLAQNQGDGLGVAIAWKLPAATALLLNLSGANSCGYTVAYHLE